MVKDRARVVLAGVLLWASCPQDALALVVSRVVIPRVGLPLTGGFAVQAGPFALKAGVFQGSVPLLKADVLVPSGETQVLRPLEAAAQGFRLANGSDGVFAAKTRLDGFFDAKGLGSSEVLARAEAEGVKPETLAREILSSRTFPEVRAKLGELGLIKESEAALDTEDGVNRFSYLVARVWHHAAGVLKRPFIADEAWPVPALIVEKEGVAYHIHPVVHGQVFPNRPGPVRRLVKSLKRAGLPLYSEENLPGLYGYSHGRETLDLKSGADKPAALRDAVGRGLVSRLVDLAFAPGLLLACLSYAALHPDNLWAWAAAPFAAVFAWLASRGFLPVYVARALRDAARERRKPGGEDSAAFQEAYASALARPRADLSEWMRADLPMPLLEELKLWETGRSKVMAAAIAAESQRLGHTQVHILTGARHAFELAWYLSNQGPTR